MYSIRTSYNLTNCTEYYPCYFWDFQLINPIPNDINIVANPNKTGTATL